MSEIKISGMVLERLIGMSKADAFNLLDVKCSPSNREVVASGFENSILLVCKLSQKMMVLGLTLETNHITRLPWSIPGGKNT